MPPQEKAAALPETKRKLVDAGVKLMRTRGFNATTVDEICAEAGVTKGGFFHYFKSKDEIARYAAVRFAEIRAKAYQEAPFRKLPDPLDRVFGRLDFAKEIENSGKLIARGCLIGMFAQEMSSANPELRGVCEDIFSQTQEDFAADLAAAKAVHAPRAGFDPKKVAALYSSIIQGSKMLAKASGNNGIFMDNIEQFRQFLMGFFGQKRRMTGKPAARMAGKSNG